MTTEQLNRMRAGRDAALVRQREEDRKTVLAYRQWVRAEAHVFMLRDKVRDELGFASEAFAKLDHDWHELLKHGASLFAKLPASSSEAWS